MSLVAFELKQRETEGIFILELRGQLVLGPGDLELRQKLQTLLDGGVKRVIVDVGGVSAIDSVAAGTLVFWSQEFRKAGGRMVLLHIVPAHTHLNDILKLDTAFENFAEEQAAVNSFFPERRVRHYDLLEFLEGEAQRRRPDLEAANKPA